MYHLITETGTYTKSYVVSTQDHPKEKPESLVGGSFCIELPETNKLVSKLTYKVELIDQSEKLDFTVKRAIQALESSDTDTVEVVKKPKKFKRPQQAENTVQQAVEPKQKRAQSSSKRKIDWASIVEE